MTLVLLIDILGKECYIWVKVSKLLHWDEHREPYYVHIITKGGNIQCIIFLEYYIECLALLD